MAGDKPKVAAKRLWGVPFYQRKREGQTPVLVCHGPDGIYKALFDQVVQKWPKEVV